MPSLRFVVSGQRRISLCRALALKDHLSKLAASQSGTAPVTAGASAGSTAARTPTVTATMAVKWLESATVKDLEAAVQSGLEVWECLADPGSVSLATDCTPARPSPPPREKTEKNWADTSKEHTHGGGQRKRKQRTSVREGGGWGGGGFYAGFGHLRCGNEKATCTLYLLASLRLRRRWATRMSWASKSRLWCPKHRLGEEGTKVGISHASRPNPYLLLPSSFFLGGGRGLGGWARKSTDAIARYSRGP